MNTRLVLKNVKAGRKNFARGKSRHQGCLIDDGASAGVDDDDAGFHLIEFMRG